MIGTKKIEELLEQVLKELREMNGKVDTLIKQTKQPTYQQLRKLQAKADKAQEPRTA